MERGREAPPSAPCAQGGQGRTRPVSMTASRIPYGVFWEGVSFMRPAKRDRKLMFWVNQNEDEAIRASAEVNAVTVAEYIRSCAVGRPVKARNRLFRAQRQLERQRVEQEAKGRQMEQLEAAKRHAATENKKAEAERRRLYQAQALAAEAGSVAGWYQGMTAKDRLKWQDLEAELLAAERLRREAEASWEKFAGSPQAYENPTQLGTAVPKPPSHVSAWRPPSSLTGERPPSLGPSDARAANFTKSQITTRREEPHQFDDDCGIIY
jgi:hypothetical protein